MPFLSESPLLFVPVPLVDATLRSTVVIAIAAVVALALRRAPAAARHLVWTLALLGCVAMPLAAPLVPGWSVPGLPAWSAGAGIAPSPARSRPTATMDTPAPGVSAAAQEEPALAAPAHATPPSSPATAWRLRRMDLLRALPLALPLAWLAGVLLILGRQALGWVRLSQLVRMSEPMADHAWQVALARHSVTLGLRRLPDLRVSARVSVPIVCGFLRPTIVLPPGVVAWSAERRGVVLLHELAHVRRLDLITTRVAQLATMLYWFHPIVWHAVRAQRAEAERACDDQVLDAGGRASTYAADLLEIAGSMAGRGSLDAAALAMTRRSQLEGRLLAILDPRLRRGGAGPWTVLVAVLVAVGTIGAIAAARPSQGRQAVEAEMAAVVVPAEATSDAKTEADASAENRQETERTRARGSDELQVAASNLISKIDSKIGTWSYRDDHGAMLRSKGKVRYSRGLDDVESISPGGWVEVEERRDRTWHKAVFKSRSGGIERSYWVDGVERPWGAEGRAWLAQFLVEIDHGSGALAEQRFPVLMSEGGPERVLREVSMMTSDYGRGLYLRRLLETDLDDPSVRKTVAQAGREIESDYELATTLIAAAKRHALDHPATGTAYIDAANTLESDYEHARTLLALVERPSLSSGLTDRAIGSASRMNSNYEQARVMIAMAEQGHVKAPLQRGFIRATQPMQSDYEKGRVLRSLLERGRLAEENIGEMLLATATFHSDYERANVLVQLARSVPMTDAHRAAYAESTRSMGSDYERDRALAALGRSFRL